MNILIRRTIILITILFCLISDASTMDNKTIFIKSIKIEGTNELKVSEIKKVMDIKFPTWVPFIRLPRYEETILKKDLKSIEKLYQSYGYFGVSVNYDIKLNKNKISIIITIKEGIYTTIRKIMLITDKQDEELRSNLLNEIEIKQGQRFQYKFYEESKKKIKNYLLNNGYGQVAVEGTVFVDRESYQSDILFIVNEGLFQYFGSVEIIGNKFIKKKHIYDEIVFDSGDVFSQEKINESQENLFNLGLFQSVKITAISSSSATIVPVKVDVSEGNKRVVKLGVGYGTEARFRTQVEWNRYYLWGAPRTLTLSLFYSSIEREVSAKYFKPYFINRKNNLTITGSVSRENVKSYVNDKLSLETQIKRMINNKLAIFVAFNVETNKPIRTNIILFEDIVAATPGSLYFISNIQTGLNYIHIDDPFYPKHGIINSFYIESASFLLGSEIDYLKGVIENHLYRTLIKDLIIVSRVKFGLIKPYHHTDYMPIFKKFFSGGSNSVRGYGFQEIGPKDEADNPIGGESIVESNIELYFPIINKFKGTVFLDAGDVYLTDFKLDIYELQYGAGTGIRYITPFGPLGLDIAFPVEHLKKIEFDMYKIHFSIGLGF